MFIHRPSGSCVFKFARLKSSDERLLDTVVTVVGHARLVQTKQRCSIRAGRQGGRGAGGGGRRECEGVGGGEAGGQGEAGGHGGGPGQGGRGEGKRAGGEEEGRGGSAPGGVSRAVLSEGLSLHSQWGAEGVSLWRLLRLCTDVPEKRRSGCPWDRGAMPCV